MKRVVSLILVLCMMLSMGAMAVEDTIVDPWDNVQPDAPMSDEQIKAYLENNPDVEVLNEYDCLIAAKNEAKLYLNSNCKDNAISENAEDILSFDPKERFYELKSYSEDYLKSMGYSEDRINIIKNFSGTDQEMRMASANFSCYTEKKASQVSSGTSWVRAKFVYSWDQTPSFCSNDLMSLGATNGFMFSESSSSNYASLNYSTTYSSASSFSKSAQVDRLQNCAGSVGGTNVPMTVTKRINGTDVVYHALSGEMQASFYRSNGDRDTCIIGQYAHSSVNVSPSANLSIGLKGSPQFTIDLDLNWGQSIVGSNDITVRI